jgi:hypothetical protein
MLVGSGLLSGRHGALGRQVRWLAPRSLQAAGDPPAQTRASRAWALAMALGALACSSPLQVHEPRQYPPIKLETSDIALAVADDRPSPADPELRQLVLPADFEGRAQQRLLALVGGQGPALVVTLTVAALDELEIVDMRGEMTRVLVRFGIEIRAKDDVVLRRAESQATSDIPRDEATPEEIQGVLDATAIEAFDRYFADAHLLGALNRDLAARAQR